MKRTKIITISLFSKKRLNIVNPRAIKIALGKFGTGGGEGRIFIVYFIFV
jgi:hypothetical protein